MPRRKNIAASLRKRNIQRSGKQAVTEKGMELPINTLVVVAIAVIVILAIAAFFMGGFGGSSKDVQNRQSFLNACSGWVQSGCNRAEFDSYPIENTFKVWQPNVNLDDLTDVLGNEVDKVNYLAGKCGCFAGAGSGTVGGTGTGTAATCSGKGGECGSAALCSSGGGTNRGKYDCTGDNICCTGLGGNTSSPPSLPV